MIAKARSVGAKGGGALLSYVLGESPGKDPEKIEVLMKRSVPDWCLWAEDYANIFAVDRMSYAGKSQKNQIDIIISPDADQTKNWNDEFWKSLRQALPDQFATADEMGREDVIVSQSEFNKLSKEQQSVVWRDKDVYYLKRNWKDNWVKVTEDFITEIDRPREEQVRISQPTFIKLKSKNKNDVSEKDEQYFRKRKYAELQLKKAKLVAALHHDAKSGIGHVHLEASRIVDGKLMDDHYIGVRARLAANSLCKKYGWQTAAEKSENIKSEIRNLAIDYLRKCDHLDLVYTDGSIYGKSWNDYKTAMSKGGWNLVETYDDKGKIQGYTFQSIEHPYRNYKSSSVLPYLALERLALKQPQLKAEYIRNRKVIGRKCVDVLKSMQTYDQDDYIKRLSNVFDEKLNYKKDSNGRLVSYTIDYGGKKYNSSDLQCEALGARELTPSRLADSWSQLHRPQQTNAMPPQTKQETPAHTSDKSWLSDIAKLRDNDIIPSNLKDTIKEWESAGAKSHMPRAGIRILQLSIGDMYLKLNIDANSGKTSLIINDGCSIRTIINPTMLSPQKIAIQTIKEQAKILGADNMQTTIKAYNEMIWSKWSVPNGEPWDLTYDNVTHRLYLSPEANTEIEKARNTPESYASSEDHKISLIGGILGFIGIITEAQTATMATGGGGGGSSDLPWRDRHDGEDDASWMRYCINQASIGRLAPPGGIGGRGGGGRSGGRRR